MSRNIKTTNSSIDEQELALRNTQNGKILFTRCCATTYHNTLQRNSFCHYDAAQGKLCALYLANNRLLAAQVMSDTANRIGAIYIGKIKNVVKNINACFLEIADKEICFLSMKDATFPILLNRNYDGRLLEGDELLVQISREAQKTKQASVTTEISLSNEYAAISVGSPKIGYSTKIDKQRKEQLKTLLIREGIQQEHKNELMQVSSIPVSIGLVVRTKANDCTEEILLHQIQTLLQCFQTMVETAFHRTCFSCIMQAPEDYEAVLDQLAYPNEYEEIVTDDAILYEKLCQYQKENLPEKQVRLYQDSILSLSKLYSLEQKLDTALNKRVWLKSGGYLIIEPTEALTVIDVNTGKYDVKKAHPSNTHQSGKALQTSKDTLATYEKINQEAAEEIALQLRLRNLSGIILVDFINMDSKEKEETLLECLRKLVRKDKIKTHIVDITPLGLVEITRKKRNRPLREQFFLE